MLIYGKTLFNLEVKSFGKKKKSFLCLEKIFPPETQKEENGIFFKLKKV